MSKIMYIDPIGTDEALGIIKKTIDRIKRDDVKAIVTHLGRGPDNLEYYYYEHLVMRELLELVKRAEKTGFSAVIIGCFYDPGLREARELTKIPVIGPAEASMHVAATLGHKFSIIVGRRKWIPKMEDNVKLYGLKNKLASFRAVNFTVNQMRQKRVELKNAIYKAAKNAIEKDGAEVIILGCTMETGLAEEIMKKLRVPVIDPVEVSWKYAEMLADLYEKCGLTHCKLFGYEPPP